MGSYRRRYYGRRRRSNTDGAIGLIAIIVFVVYSYSVALKHLLIYVVAAVFAILALMIAIKLWKRRRKSHISFSTQEIVADIETMTGLEFEKHVAALLKERGYTNVRLTEYYDLGVDIIARKNDITWGIQVKRRNGMVKAAAVRQVVTALKKYNCDRAMVITNGTYSRPAIELAKSNDCLLVTI